MKLNKIEKKGKEKQKRQTYYQKSLVNEKIFEL